MLVSILHRVSGDGMAIAGLSMLLWWLGALASGPEAQREIKALFAQLEVGPVTEEVRELTAQAISRIRGTDEAREGLAAFLGKRPANWIPEENI